MHRIVLAGSVTSSMTTLKKLVEHEMNVIGVFGYEPQNSSVISGYVNMQAFCEENDIPYFSFQKIRAEEVQSRLQDLAPDLFFVIGLSQLVPEEMLQIATHGNIGFHPTLLPKGRGRAPIAWLILEEQKGAANFFLMGKGADDGPIFVQVPFEIAPGDDAQSVENKINGSIEIALDKWLPQLKEGVWNPIPQDEVFASYYGKRNPEDGWINWNKSAEEIDKLIRASATPHPGAFTFLGRNRLIIQKCKLEKNKMFKGVVGRILLYEENEYLVQTGSGLLWIFDIKNESGENIKLKVGDKLGYYYESEIFEIRRELQIIKERLGI